MEMLYPTYIFEGHNYPLSPERAFLSKIVSMAQFGAIIFAFLGNKVEAIRNHPLYHKFEENRMMYMLGMYFGLNMLQNFVSSTGAFEIYLNDQLIFSKLATGRVPSFEELEHHLR